MMNYESFLKGKVNTLAESGFEIDEEILNPLLKPFQKWCVRVALKKGRYAFFEDCGLGKTFQQLEWAKHVVNHTGKDVLILAPLAVSSQTIQEGKKFGIPVFKYSNDDLPVACIHISNYEQIENIDCDRFAGVVLDESSILKNYEGSIRNQLIEKFKNTTYKLCCTATPSPNDPMELGNHSEFLGVMSRNEMLSMYFVHDGGETAKWRLKGHSVDRFWQWVSTWAVMLSKPSDIGYSNDGYELPPLNYVEHQIITPKTNNGQLFNDASISATNHNGALRDTMQKRMDKVVEIVNKQPDGDWIIWVKLNDEEKLLKQLIPNAVVVTGSDTNDDKESKVLWFTKNICLCNSREGKKNIRQSTQKNGKPKTGKKDPSNKDKDLQIAEMTTQNGTNNGNDTTESITRQIKNEQRSIVGITQTIGTKSDDHTTIEMSTTEKSANHSQKSLEKKIRSSILETPLKETTGLPSKITDDFSQSKTINAPSVKENPLSLPASKDYTSTTATQQAKYEDYCASTATKQSENLTITSNYSNEQSCTCGANSTGKIIISKSSIIGFGVNAQNCHNQVFASLDFSFEALYQSIRRSYRFGQTKSVNIHLITTDTMLNVKASIQNKQKQFEEMQKQMQDNMNKSFAEEVLRALNVDLNGKDQVKTDAYWLMKGDCVKRSKEIDDESVGFTIFSPPFAELYVYSDNLEDMGNSKNYRQFLRHFSFLIPEIYRIMMPGRNVAIHCMSLPVQKGKEGYIGLRDFPGMIIKAFEKNGFIFHDEIAIWKDPVVEMQRTKALGLLHKQVKKDSAMSRTGIHDKLIVFRKPGINPEPIQNKGIPVDLWQKYASPVWYDINYSNTLNLKGAREEKDEKHICPLQLDTIERAIHLWSNKGDRVFTPFLGIGSEVYQAVLMGRYGIGTELKNSYFVQAVKNTKNANARKDIPELFQEVI